jgi:hypothetical protein
MQNCTAVRAKTMDPITYAGDNMVVGDPEAVGVGPFNDD